MKKTNFDLGDQLMEGEGYTLSEGQNILNQEQVIIKCIQPDDYKQGCISEEQIFNNLEKSKQFTSSSIVQCFINWKDKGNIYQVQERCDVNLNLLIQQQYTPQMPNQQQEEGQLQPLGTIIEHDAILIMKQILSGMQELYELGLVHRDLSSTNILVKQVTNEVELKRTMQYPFQNQQFNNFEFKINDFIQMTDKLDYDKFNIKGKQPAKLDNLEGMNNFVQPSHASPQILELMLQKQSEYSSKTDVFSLGCIFYELIYGEPPFDVSNIPNIDQIPLENQIDTKITLIQNGLKLPHHKPITNLTRDFLQKTLTYDENKRLSLPEVYKHNLFRQHFTELFQDLMASQLNQSKLQTKSAQTIIKLRNYVDKNKTDLAELFDKVDTDGNGFLDDKEFYDMLNTIDSTITKNESDVVFRKLDTNKTKQIRIKEFSNIFMNQKISKELIKRLEEIQKHISQHDKTPSELFDEHHIGNGRIQFMEFDKLLQEIQINYDTRAVNQLFAFFSDNKAQIKKKDFIQKIQANYEYQTDFLLNDDIKELALKQMNNLRDVFKEKEIDIMEFFYTKLQGESEYIYPSDIQAILEEHVPAKNTKYIYQYFQYIHNNKNLINWQYLAKALYPRGTKTKLKAMNLVQLVKQMIKNEETAIDWTKKNFDRPYIISIFRGRASDEDIDILFDYFDLDKDGIISNIELRNNLVDIDENVQKKALEYLKKLKKKIKREEWSIDKIINKNENQLYRLDDFKNIFPHLNEQEAIALYQYIDNDNNGVVTYDEIKEILTEQDKRIVQQASDIMKRFKATIQKRAINVELLFDQNDIGEGKKQQNFVSRTMLMDMFEKMLTQETVKIICEVYGDPKTEMIYYEDLLNLLVDKREKLVESKKNSKKTAMEHIIDLKKQIEQKNINFKELFKIYDKEGEGTLSYRQLKLLFKKQGINLSDEDLGEICDFLDEDGDNELSYKEIARYINQGRRPTNPDNASNVSTAIEAIEKFKKLMNNYDYDIRQVMEEFDTYGTGKLTKKQFVNVPIFKEFHLDQHQVSAIFDYISGGSNKLHYKQFLRELQ